MQHLDGIATPFDDRIERLVSSLSREEKVRRLMHEAPAVERVDLPEYNWWNECLHGVGRAGIATVFPQSIGLAATWNTRLMQQVGDVVALEARAKHHEALRNGDRGIYKGLTLWSPNINIFRDPRWGRGQETYGEDPHLTGEFAVAFLRGLQGDHPKYLKTSALVKHFAVHSGPEQGRHEFDSRIDARDLHETYLPAFRKGVIEGRASGLMSSYNRLNGVPCTCDPWLLTELLRDRWGFNGYVVSDVGAVADIWQHHRYVETGAEACALSVKAGCDLNGGWEYHPHLLEALEKGLIEEAEIDRALRRTFRILFRLGLYDDPAEVPGADTPIEVNDTPEHRALARRAAQESMVLLKNDGVLPLSPSVRSIAVVGPNADSKRVLLGNYHGTPSESVTLLEGIRNGAPEGTAVHHAKGCELAASTGDMLPVPPAVLRPHEGDEEGLLGEYFDGHAFPGEPVLRRIDPEVQFAWGDQQPDIESFSTPRFSVRWRGTLSVPRSGDYRLGLTGDADLLLFVDGVQCIEKKRLHGFEIRQHTMRLEAGRAYDVRIEYDGNGNAASARFMWMPPEEESADPFREALDAAAQSDVVVACMGLSADLEGEEGDSGGVKGFLGGDRTSLDLPGRQEELLAALFATGKPVVVVLQSGSALAVNSSAERAAAILQAWYPGEEGGNALADILFGTVSPAGRLPVTLYRSEQDLPPFTDYAMEGRTYRFFRGEPLYPFGFGLSYSRFEWSDLRIEPRPAAVGDEVVVAATVRNIGERPADEVAQLYLTRLDATERVPIRSLAAFERLTLAPGERVEVKWRIEPRAFSIVRPDGVRVLEAGEFELSVGGKQPGFTGRCDAATTNTVSARLTLEGETRVLPP